MSGPSQSGERSLPLSAVLRQDDACLRFEAAWQAGTRPRIEDYLASLPEPERAALLHELLAIELGYRLRHGERPSLEEYAPRFPDHLAGLQAAFAAVPVSEPSAADGHALPLTPTLLTPEGGANATHLPGPRAAANDLPHVAGYEVLGVLGRGGMGVVYKAREVKLNRLVALKMVLAGAHAGPEALARFQREAEAVACLQHPLIVRIYAVGEHDGLPYLALEFLEGGSLSQKLDGTPLTPRVAAALVEKLARAIDAAHERGVIHRDLKPANILLTAEGEPKVADFGLAKQLDSATGPQTRTGAVLGTPSYMAPEQAEGRSQALGPATDVYALGAILYEALTGRPPFKAETALETLTQVVMQEVVPPSRLQPKVPRDLETICLKCLEKAPPRRYATAQAVAADLQRYLAGEPIAARPAAPWERAVKWARRRPAIAGLWAGIVGVFLLGFVLVAWQAYRAQRAADLADRHRQEAVTAQQNEQDRANAEAEAKRQALRTSATLALARAQSLGEQSNPAEALLWLAEGLRLAPDDAAALQRAFRANWSHWQTQLILTQCLEDTRPVTALAFSPDGKLLLTCNHNLPTAVLWDVALGKALRTLQHPGGGIRAVAFHPGGKLVAAGGARASPSGGVRGFVQLWDVATGKPVGQPLFHEGGNVDALAFSPDGKRLATVDNPPRKVRVWDLASGAWIGPGWVAQHADKLAFFPDNRTLLAGGWGSTTRQDAVTGALIGEVHSHPPGRVPAFAIPPDGKTFLTGSDRVRCWDADTGKLLAESVLLPGPITALAFSPDGRRFVTGSADGQARVWDTAAFRPGLHTGPHLGSILSVAFTLDGKRFATSCRDRTVRLWTPQPGAHAGTPWGPPQPGAVTALASTPDGRFVVAQANTNSTQFLEGATGQRIGPPFLGARRNGPLLSADGSRVLLFTQSDGGLRLWQVATRQPAGQPIPDSQ
jgi:WD40 repeat protein/tRNA A-37 threonylcarbamoyl transferase component Bud32